jgi:hypothetical membrane protein
VIASDIPQRFSPLRQALACAGLAFMGMVVCHFIYRGDTYEFMAAFTGILLYALMNSIISIFHTSFAKYTWPSWGLFVLMFAALLLIARYMSGTSIWQLNAYRMMVGSIVAFYIISSLLVRLIRTIWEFAEADEN